MKPPSILSTAFYKTEFDVHRGSPEVMITVLAPVLLVMTVLMKMTLAQRFSVMDRTGRCLLGVVVCCTVARLNFADLAMAVI